MVARRDKVFNDVCHNSYVYIVLFFPAALRPNSGQDLLIVEVSARNSLIGHTTVGRTPLDERPASRRDLNLTTHNTNNRQTFIPSARFEPTISAGERPQTYALDRAATGTGLSSNIRITK
jgi:hypothetical protein